MQISNRTLPLWKVLRFILFLLLLAVILRNTHATSAQGQSQSDLPSYWQYATSGRLLQLHHADIDRDGVEEFIIADENNHVDLVNAAGKQVWSYVAPDRVTAVSSIPALNSLDEEAGILLGLPNQIILLSTQGEELWRAPVNPLDAQTSLRGSGAKSADSQLEGYEFVPVALAPTDQNGDGQPEILTLLQSGELLLFDIGGTRIWQYTGHPSEGLSATPRMLLTDLDQDGREEIVLAVYDPRRFSQLVLLDDGRAIWELSLSRQISGLVEVDFGPGGRPLIAVSTSLGHVYTYNYERQRQWLRTLNVPVTALAALGHGEASELAVGTSAGTVLSFNSEGRRLWTAQLSDSPDKPVLNLAPAPPGLGLQQPVVAAIVDTDRDEADVAGAFLLNRAGQAVAKVNNVDSEGLTRITDSNRDGNGELLIAHFATLEMLGIGVGNSGNVQEWEYSLNAAPAAALVADVDGDGNQEMIIGTKDGRVHNLNGDRSLRWLHNTGGTISHLTLLPQQGRGSSLVIAGTDPQNPPETAAWLQLREADGERLWEQRLDSPITAVLVADVLPSAGHEIIVGNEAGELLVFTAGGELHSRFNLDGGGGAIDSLAFLPGLKETPGIIAAASGSNLFAVDLTDQVLPVRSLARLGQPIRTIIQGPAAAEEELAVRLAVLTADGKLHGLNWRGVEMAQWQWPAVLGGTPTVASDFADQDSELAGSESSTLLYGTAEGQLARLEIRNEGPLLAWEFSELGDITAVHGYDQDENGLPELVFTGSRSGAVNLFAEADTDAPQLVAAPLELSSAIFALGTVRRDVGLAPDVMVVTENGLVQLFRDQENRPPLLTNPVVETEGGQYSVSVTVNDVERDEVLVNLEVRNSAGEQWQSQGPQRLAEGFGTLFWALPATAAGPDGFNYRLVFSDGSYRGSMTPPPGPPAPAVSPWTAVSPLLFGSVIFFVLVAVVAFTRQARTPGARAARFYSDLKRAPQDTLRRLEKQAQAENLQVLMPYLASHARQQEDRLVANLADGLFLLNDQPQSGVSILNAALQDLRAEAPAPVSGLAHWEALFSTSQALLDAPTVAELTLLQARLQDMLQAVDAGHAPLTAMSLLPAVLSSLRDSERVTLAEDRLVYLNEAGSQIVEAQSRLPAFNPGLERLLATVLLRRWAGLVSAETEDLRGRAELAVTLKTRRLVPSDETVLAFEVSNNGRAAAEQIIATLEADPAYTVISPPQIIPLLPAGRSREIRFTISPLVADRFRAALTLHYGDRSLADRTQAFGDMVHLLQPVREFAAVTNPYTPGTALRPDSLIFFGRDDLFSFISENAGRRSYRNVLILVGQRRTGKTSALLRLEHNLPPHLLPVYIDCQSLGVVPGMPALLEELAWYIADALARHGIDIEVPPLDAWQRDPTRLFQRRFLPQVNALLPEETTLLLVFDEFEAFENLVADGILPATFFTYLRHLMQHGEQLNFIFVGTRRLEEMTSDYWSVLFNIALYRKITFLDKEAATRLITEPVAPQLVYDDLALDKILRVTAGHPYFLQLVCYTLVKRANNQRSAYVTVSDVNAAVEEMLMLGEVHFAYLWQRSSLSERTILTAVAHLTDPNLPFSAEELIERLGLYDIHVGLAEAVTALTSLVERDILAEITEEAKTVYELRLGLVGLWVARNKSLSKLFSSPPEAATPARPVTTVRRPVDSIAD